MENFQTLRKNHKRFYIISAILSGIVLVLLFLLDIFVEIDGIVGDVLFVSSLIIMVLCIILMVILFRKYRWSTARLEEYLSKYVPLGYTFSYLSAYCDDYYLQSNYSDKKVKGLNRIEGTINNIEFERFYIELYNEDAEFIRTNKSYAHFYVFKNIVSNDVDQYIMSNDIKWELLDKEYKTYKFDKFNVVSKANLDYQLEEINIDKSYFISIYKGNIYVYKFYTKDELDINKINSKEEFILEFNKSIDETESIYNIIKKII